MEVSLFDYDLPSELIAQHPPAERGDSRMLVLSRADGAIVHRSFPDLPEYLRPGDCLVVNETRVIPARLNGRRRPTGGRVELLLLRAVDGKRWEALARPARRKSTTMIATPASGSRAAAKPPMSQSSILPRRLLHVA